MPKSRYEVVFARQLEGAGLHFEREARFHPERKWRFDFANPDLKLAFEIEGGIWTRGRHTRGSGFIGDCEKYAEANLLGWYVYRVPASWIRSGRALALARRAVEALRSRQPCGHPVSSIVSGDGGTHWCRECER